MSVLLFVDWLSEVLSQDSEARHHHSDTFVVRLTRRKADSAKILRKWVAEHENLSKNIL